MAIALHKLLIAFVVGLDVYAETNSLKRVIAHMLPFSIISPVGVFVACFTKVSVGPKTNAILSAVATGSLLYITFFELMLRERTSPKSVPSTVQFVAVLFGFASMSLLALLFQE